MAWRIIGPHHDETTIAALVEAYPDLVAYDESGFDISLPDFEDRPEELADDGYFDRASRRILFWATEADSVHDAGEQAVAEARWEG
jgi:hypothetical protein